MARRLLDDAAGRTLGLARRAVRGRLTPSVCADRMTPHFLTGEHPEPGDELAIADWA
jgi:hypothetical protein